MASRKKYPSPPRPAIKEDEKHGILEPLGGNLPKGKEVRVYDSDGTLEVENLVERSSDKLSFQSSKNVTSFYFNKSLDSNTEIQLVPQNVDKVYKTTATYKGEVKEAFAVFRNDVKKFITKNMKRYKTLPKPLRKKIDTVLENKQEYIFTEEIHGTPWCQVFIDKTHFGPYNYDVKLQVTKDIEMINDLIVIRTGDFADKYDRGAGKNCYLPNNWGIAWVSPHYLVNYSGGGNFVLNGSDLVSTWTGASSPFSGVNRQTRNYKVVNNHDAYGASSKFFTIPAGQKLYSGLTYKEIPKSGDLQSHYGEPDPATNDFFYGYTGYHKTGAVTKYNTGGWDGVIPSGTWFDIETWSTNPKYIGFDGEITVYPVSSTDPTCTLSTTTSGTASDLDYQQSVRKAIKQAKKKFFKQLNNILVSKGIKNQNARSKRYNKMLERVAQNVYDGLSLVRNEQIAKAQGMEANPLSGPVYYDGASKMYGGNDTNANYTKQAMTKARQDGSFGTGGTANY